MRKMEAEFLKGCRPKAGYQSKNHEEFRKGRRAGFSSGAVYFGKFWSVFQDVITIYISYIYLVWPLRDAWLHLTTARCALTGARGSLELSWLLRTENGHEGIESDTSARN
jgi:hypothetical protein